MIKKTDLQRNGLNGKVEKLFEYAPYLISGCSLLEKDRYNLKMFDSTGKMKCVMDVNGDSLVYYEDKFFKTKPISHGWQYEGEIENFDMEKYGEKVNTCHYDKFGNIISIKFFDDEGGDMVENYHEFEYDVYGNKIRFVVFENSVSNRVKTISKMKYDIFGNMIERFMHLYQKRYKNKCNDLNGEFYCHDIMKYDNNGNLIEIQKFDENQNLIKSEMKLHKYDIENNLIETYRYLDNGLLEISLSYKYDRENNWIEKIEYAGSLTTLIKREITYSAQGNVPVDDIKINTENWDKTNNLLNLEVVKTIRDREIVEEHLKNGSLLLVKSESTAYIIPKDLFIGQRVFVEDLIEDHIGTIKKYRGSFERIETERLKCAQAIWNGKDLEMFIKPPSVMNCFNGPYD